VITGNTITDSQANGIDVAGALVDVTITGNTIRNIRGYGIVLNGPVAGGVIRGNTIEHVEKNGILVDNWIFHHFPDLSARPQHITIEQNIVAETGDEHGGPIAVRMPGPDVTVSGNTVR
jgi:parallel beta-helix repeat protein